MDKTLDQMAEKSSIKLSFPLLLDMLILKMFRLRCVDSPIYKMRQQYEQIREESGPWKCQVLVSSSCHCRCNLREVLRWSTLSVAEFSPLTVGLSTRLRHSSWLTDEHESQARPIVNRIYGAIIRGRVSFFTLSQFERQHNHLELLDLKPVPWPL